MTINRLIEHLSDPRAYAISTASIEIHQTHISVVFVTDRFAYKIKKPVILDFLDYGTLEKRRHWCEEEVRLNRRLASHIYLGVVPITQDGSNLRVEGTGPAVEWAVKMHRLSHEASLVWAVKRDELNRESVELLARRIADFHRQADRGQSIARFGRFDVVARNAHDNFEHSALQVGTTVSHPVFDRVRELTDETLARCRALIEGRADRGIPCDGHGDIRMDHVYLFPESAPPDDVAIVDCIEFNLRFRAADPVADMAFLVMDLIRHGRRDLAYRFRDGYLASACDDEAASLVPFYVAYRAAVRAKVNGIKANASELSASDRTRAQHDARAQWLLALGSLEDGRRRPGLVLIAGLPGTGKSTLARELASQAGFEVIRSDQIRKELAETSRATGVDGGEGYGSGIYAPEWNERTYLECLMRAEVALFEGRRVIIDASFRDEAQRRRFLELATAWCVPVVLLICQADVSLVKTRLEGRRDDVSDADWAIYLEAAKRWDPMEPRTQRVGHFIDTGRSDPTPLTQSLDLLRRYEIWE